MTRYYIGVDKPVVEHSVVETDWRPYWELEISDGDHLRIDEQPFEPEEYDE